MVGFAEVSETSYRNHAENNKRQAAKGGGF
jgi:hypothetical protein